MILFLPPLHSKNWGIYNNVLLFGLECLYILYNFYFYKPEKAIQCVYEMCALVLVDLFIFDVLASIYFAHKYPLIVQGRDIPIVHRVIKVCMTYIFCSKLF